MAAFRSSVIPFPPSVLEPGSCQAVRIGAILNKPVTRVKVTPEWLEMNQSKQGAYERKRAEWRENVGVVDMK